MKTINNLISASLFLSVIFVLAIFMPGVVHAQYNCMAHSYEKCLGNNLYWYDSCGNLQDLLQYCGNGCHNNACSFYAPTTYGGCTYHAYKLCQANNIYWYDSCGTQQDLFSACTAGQTCQYGQCVAAVQSYTAPVSSYATQYKIACYKNSLYWYDSFGAVSGLYKSCPDSNSCAIGGCANNNCSIATKCDGSTCAVGSTDYSKYCQPAAAGVSTQVGATINIPHSCGNGVCETNLGETNANCPNDCKTITKASTTPISNQATAAISTTQKASGFWGFVSRWYLWVLGTLVLVFLFIAVFKRLSSEA